jgi:hypothetical protein
MNANSKNLHSKELSEILSKPPTWLLKWGVLVFLGLIVLIGWLSVVIHYPDTIKTTITVYSKGSSHPIHAKSDGKLLKLLVIDKQQVVAGQPLAYLSSLSANDSIIYSPLKGVITFIGLIGVQKQVKANQPLFYVDPGDMTFYGEIVIPPNQVARVKKGCIVLIRQSGNQGKHQDYIKGVIDTIGKLPFPGCGYVSEVRLFHINKRSGLKTGMIANATILIDDISMAKRIFNNTKSSFSFR